MEENYAIKNKLVNLIPIVHPQLVGNGGILAALKYREGSFQEIDSSGFVREAFTQFYPHPVPESADTIFNAFIPFMDFCRAKLIKQSIKIPKDKATQYVLVQTYLDDIFNGYNDLRDLFDCHFDLMYSFSNLMPVPRYFNGSRFHKGKGTNELNKDYPSKYLENLRDPNSGIYKREEMLTWMNEVIDSYKIKGMYNIKPPYSIAEYYGYDDRKLSALSQYLHDANSCIEGRFHC